VGLFYCFWYRALYVALTGHQFFSGPRVNMFTGLRSRFAGPRPLATTNVESAIAAYANAALKGLPPNKRNIKPFKNAANKWLNATRVAALGPAGAVTPEQAISGAELPSANYGLTQAYMNLKNKINVVNKTALANISTRVKTIVNQAQSNNKPEVIKLREQVQRELAKANAIISANTGLSVAIKSFMATLKRANGNNNAAYKNKINSAWVQLPQPVQNAFKNNYNKAMSGINQSKATVTRQANSTAKAAPMMRNVAGASYFISNVNKNLKNASVVYKKANNGNGYFQGNVTKAGIFGGRKVTMKSNVRFNYNNATRSFMARVPGVAGPPL